MKHHNFKDYICIGLTAFCVLAAGIAFFFCLYEMDAIRNGINNLFRILTPIIYGVVFAYLMSPLYNHFTRKLYPFLFKIFFQRQVSAGTGSLRMFRESRGH